MRKIIPLCVAAGLAAGVAGCGDDDDKTETLTLGSKGGRTLYLEEQGARGPSVGDERAFSQTITQDGKPIGRLDGTVTITAIVGGVEQRIGTVQYTLPGGTIVASGVYLARPRVFIPAKGVTRAIVGGTGKYKGASGEVTQKPTPDGEIESTIDLTLPDD